MHRELTTNSQHNPANDSPFHDVERMEQDVRDIIDALALLGVKRCIRCRKFFQMSEPGNLFDFGQLVCFGCIPDWWSSYSKQLNSTNREEVERKLSSWLRKYHRAELVREAPATLESTEFQIVTTCGECRGSGKILDGQRCRFCNGLGTVWIVVPK